MRAGDADLGSAFHELGRVVAAVGHLSTHSRQEGEQLHVLKHHSFKGDRSLTNKTLVLLGLAPHAERSLHGSTILSLYMIINLDVS